MGVAYRAQPKVPEVMVRCWLGQCLICNAAEENCCKRVEWLLTSYPKLCPSEEPLDLSALLYVVGGRPSICHEFSEPLCCQREANHHRAGVGGPEVLNTCWPMSLFCHNGKLSALPAYALLRAWTTDGLLVTCSPAPSLPAGEIFCLPDTCWDQFTCCAQFVLAFLGKACCALGHLPALHQELWCDDVQCLEPPVNNASKDYSTDITRGLKLYRSEVIFRWSPPKGETWLYKAVFMFVTSLVIPLLLKVSLLGLVR